MTLEGGCLCRGISYVVSGSPRDVVNCHCERCRRFTGHFMAATRIPVADLALDDPDDLLRWWWPVPEAGYAFCSRCGSSLFWRAADDPAYWSVCAGTLDPPTGLTTTATLWVSQASDYHVRQDVEELETE
jgi:hypothetical protein